MTHLLAQIYTLFSPFKVKSKDWKELLAQTWQVKCEHLILKKQVKINKTLTQASQ
jgi:predicted SprT family Zn-dependent metalloprotease